jgi:hypothetical protein
VDTQVTELSEKLTGLTVADEDVPLVHELDLESIPAGRISKLWVTLFENALKPQTVPLIIAKGISLYNLTDMRSSSWSYCGYDVVVARR